MAESVTHVIYEALADFSSLHAAAAGAVADLDAIKRKEAEVNAASASGSHDSAAARDADTASMQKQQGFLSKLKGSLTDLFQTQKQLNDETVTSAKTVEAQNNSLNESIKAKAAAKQATSSLKDEVTNLAKATEDGAKKIDAHAKSLDNDTKKVGGFGAAVRKTISDLTDADVVARRSSSGFDFLGNSLQKVLTAGNGRGGMAPLAFLLPLIAGILAVVNPVVAGIGAIGGALFGLISNLGSLVGVLAVVPGSILAFVSSLGVLKLAFSGVGTALQDYQALQQTAITDTKAHSAALQKYEDDLKKLSPAAQTFTKWLISMNGAWSSLKSSISQNFFSGFVNDLSGVGPVFQVITTVMNKAASAVGGVVDQFLKLMQTTGTQTGLAIFGDQNAKLISTIGSGLLSILDTIGKLTVAAGPFTQLVAEGLAHAADSLDRIVSQASSDGSLESWLTRVYSNLQLWWGIVSDIGKTIFNYGSAASSFGTWITTGLKDVTDSWEKASEAALKPGSTFKQWLEDIKPLVTELSTIIGNFLSWWNQTATNKNDINKMLTMLKDINDHLGPALGDLLKTMANTTIGPDLIKFITTVVQMVDTIMSNGGAEVLQGVIHFLTELASFIKDVAQVPGVAPALMTIATALSVIAALSFVNKFVPLIDAISWLLRLADAEGPLTKVFNSLSHYKGPADVPVQTSTTGNGTSIITSSGKKAKKPSTVEDSPSSKQIKDEIGVVSGEGSEAGKTTGTLGKILGGGKSILGLGLKGLGGALGAAYLGSMLYGAATDNSKPVKNFNAGTGNNWGGTALGAGSGALAGASFGPLDPLTVPIGAGIGAASSTTGANGKNVLSNILDPKQWEIGAKQIVDALSTANDAVGKFAKGLQKNVGDIFSGLGKKLGTGAKQIGDFFTKTLPSLAKGGNDKFWDGMADASVWLSKQSKKFTTWVKDLPHNIGAASRQLWDDLVGLDAWLKVQTKSAETWAKNLPGNVGKWIGDVFKNVQDINAWLLVQASKAETWVESLPGKFAKWAGNVFNKVQSINAWLLVQEAKAASWVASLPGKFATWAGNVWRSVGTIQTWIEAQEVKAYNWFRSLPGKIASWAGNTFGKMKGIGSWISEQASSLASFIGSIPGKIAAAFSAGWNSAPKNPQGHAAGGMIYRASGGEVPGEGDGDTVPAMLTPGEIVINKKVVNAVGAQNLLNLNSGLISFSEMLNQAMSSAQTNKSKGSAYPDFLSGAGLSGYSSPALQSFNAPSAAMFNSNSSSSVTHHTGTTIGQIVVNNPKPEPTSDSLPRTLRKASYLSLARGR